MRYADDPELQAAVAASGPKYKKHAAQEESRLKELCSHLEAVDRARRIEDAARLKEFRAADYPRLEAELRAAQETIKELEYRNKAAQELLSGEWDGY